MLEERKTRIQNTQEHKILGLQQGAKFNAAHSITTGFLMTSFLKIENRERPQK